MTAKRGEKLVSKQFLICYTYMCVCVCILRRKQQHIAEVLSQRFFVSG